MLFILDNKQNTVGIASNSNPHSLPYFDDWHTETLDGVNTYEFSVPAEHPDAKLIEVEGHVIVRNLDGENILFTIKEIADGNSDGKKIKSVFCEDTAITELLSDVQRPATFKSTTLEAVVGTVVSNTFGWTLGDVPYTDSYDVEFSDYTSVLEALRQVVSQFGKEVYFTVVLNGTKIAEKHINIVDERGTKTNTRFDYTYDLKGVSRTEDSSKIVTALVGVGKGDNAGERVNLSSLPAFVDGDFFKDAGADWIGSETALQQFGKNGRHRFGVYIDEESDTPEELKRRTLKELAERIIPDVHYSASITTLERLTGYEAKKIRLGDTVLVNDKSFEPAIVVNGRVNELKRSYTRIDVDEVGLGKYKAVTLSPNKSIYDLQKLITKNQEQWKTSGTYLSVEALGGNTFKNGSGSTTLRAKVYSAGLEEDSDGTAYTYKWFKYNQAGTLITNWGGTTDYRTGKELNVTSLDVDTQATFVCVVDNVGQGQLTVFEVFDGEKGDTGSQGIQGVQGVRGADGTTYYTWVKYADSPTTGMSDNPTGKSYMGLAYNKLTPTESTNYADYSWSLIKGEKGDTGERGLTGLQGEKGDQGIQGVAGSDGVSSYTHIAYATNSTGTSGFSLNDPTNKTYIGIYVDTVATDSTDPTKYKWTLIKGQKGDQGIQGQTGADGQTPYFHTAWSNSADGSSGFSTTDSTNKLYIGTYTDFTVNDSTNPSTYSWTRIKGDKGDTGSQGIKGDTGADGITYYTWIKYADTPTTGMSDTPDGKNYMGIAVGKTSPTESNVYSDYKWSLIKGDQGVRGNDGKDGQPTYTWIKYATSSAGANMSDDPTGKPYIGLAYNKLTQTESNVASDYTWSLIQGEQGEQGIPGNPGNDGVTTFTWVKYADDELGNGMSDSSSGKRYLGLAYNKTTQTESTNKADYTWSPLYDNVSVGGRNLILDSLIEETSNAYGFGQRDLSMPLEAGVSYVFTFSGHVDQQTLTDGKQLKGYIYEENWATSVSVGLTSLTDSTAIAYYTPTVSGNFKASFYLYPSGGSRLGEVTVNWAKLERGNVATDWTQAPEDVINIGSTVSDLNEKTDPVKIVDTVITDEAFKFIMNGKANAEDISDMATGEMLTDSETNQKKYVDGRLDGEGGVIEGINEVKSSLEKTAESINAKFQSSGGINLVRNSLGFAGFDFWTVTGSNLQTIQNQELEQLGFGSGFYKPIGGSSPNIEQVINIQPKNADGTPRVHSLSMWLNKKVDNATNGWAVIEVYAGGSKILEVGKHSGKGVTQGWELGIGQFTTEYSEVTIRVAIGQNAEATITGLMVNVGSDALQWQHHPQEIYNTNIQMNLNGLKVINGQTKGYTIMSPQEFSGYAEVIDENNNAVMTRVFTLNGATTEVTQLDVDNEIKMGSMTARLINTGSNKGWAFIADE